MTPCFLAQLFAVCAAVYAHSSEDKGSDTHEINDEEASNTEDSAEQREQKRKTGAQDKFWIPTYPGSNPLNRKNIEITNSEIERFDSSIDVSLSGVIRNGTRAPRKKPPPENNLSKVPYFWSGENISNNITVKDLASLDSSLVTVESGRSRDEDSTEFKRNYSPFTWSKSNTSYNTGESSEQSEELSSTSTSKESTNSKKPRNQKKVQTKKATHSPENGLKKVRSGIKTIPKTTEGTSKPIINQLKHSRSPSTKSEMATNETVLSREYYKKMVEAAVENTKRKLGYRELSEIINQTFKPIVPDSLTTDSKGSAPEIYKVNMDKVSRERVKSEEKINFETKHDQFLPIASKLDTETRERKGKDERVKTLAQELVGKPKEEKIHWNLTQGELGQIYKKQREVDFPSSVQYDAWSDVLLLNRTQRKSKQRKPKTGKLSNSNERSSGDMRAWPGKKIQEKANELRKKEGKLTRKDKRKRAQKNKEKKQRDEKEVSDKNIDYKDVYQDSPETAKTQREKKSDEYDYKVDSLDYDSRLRGKGGGEKTDYDYSYNEYSDSSKEDRKQRMRKKTIKKDPDSEKPEKKKKFRMTTIGEKRHAYKEVKSYLNEMDEEYGGRPGGDTYYREKRGRGSSRGRGWDKQDDDRGRFRTERREGGGFERGRERNSNWGYTGRGGGRGRDNWDNRDRGGVWDQRGRGGGWGRDDRGRGGGWGRDDRGRSGGWGRDDRGRGGGWGRDDRGRGGGWGRDDRGRGGGWGRDDRVKGRDRRGRGRGSGRGGGGRRG